MSDKSPTPTMTTSNVASDSVRSDVFLALVGAKEPLSPTEIGDEIGETRQTVMYHLETLVGLGLVIRDDGEYFCQPLFIDPEFQAVVEDMIVEVVEESKGKIHTDPETGPDEGLQTAANCIKAAIAMWLTDEQ